MMDYELLPPSALMHKVPLSYLNESGFKWRKGGLGVLAQKILKLVDVISLFILS